MKNGFIKGFISGVVVIGLINFVIPFLYKPKPPVIMCKPVALFYGLKNKNIPDLFSTWKVMAVSPSKDTVKLYPFHP